jgi:CTD kinase subunit alpha
LSSRPPTASDIPSRRRPTPNFDSRSASRPESRDPKSAGNSRRRKSHGTPNSSGKFDLTSGANSIEVNMAARGNFRGGYRPYSHNSGHGTPNSSYHGSPTGPAHSPYGNNGRGWSNQQPYSPQQ